MSDIPDKDKPELYLINFILGISDASLDDIVARLKKEVKEDEALIHQEIMKMPVIWSIDVRHTE